MPLTHQVHLRSRLGRNLPSVVVFIFVAAMLSVVPILAGRWARRYPSSSSSTSSFSSHIHADRRSTSKGWGFLPTLRGGREKTFEAQQRRPHRDGGGQATTTYRTVQVQLVHRHGDRTPITPLRNESYWASTLVPPDMADKISRGTTVVRTHDDHDDGGRKTAQPHAASGRGPFGKLTRMGLLQMIEVGSRLRDELEGPQTVWAASSTLFSPLTSGDGAPNVEGRQQRHQLHPQHVKVYSTDFERTIQSAQAVLVGFFPDGPPVSSSTATATIPIECRHTTSWMIPDPQPRRTKEQEGLEWELARRPHVLEREAEMRPLAVRCSRALSPLLGPGAFDISFGVGEEEDDEEETNDGGGGGGGEDAGAPPHHSQRERVLPWSQLAEITKCLSVRGLLPDSILDEDREALSAHSAWRWFESLRHPRLAYLSMHVFTGAIVRTMRNHPEEPPVIIYSCHDSSLIGLLCAFHLEQPSVWPEYGSVLKIELLERQSTHTEGGDPAAEKDYAVRFSLNGEALRSQWHGDLRDEISLDKLAYYVSTEGADEGRVSHS
jgi:Histidine phosphatase superfamily (branch 2)